MSQNPSGTPQAAEDIYGPSDRRGQRESSTSTQVYAEIARTGVRRDTTRQWFGGVCAGVARRFNVDPILIRAAAIALAFVGGVGIFIYIVAWLVLPDDRGRIMLRDAFDPNQSVAAKIGSIALIGAAGVVLIGVVFGMDRWAFGWGVVLAAIIGFVLWRVNQPRSTPNPPLTGSETMSPTPTNDPMYAVSAPPASVPTSGGGSTSEWTPPPPTTPPPPQDPAAYAATPPPGPRRRTAGFFGFAFVLGVAIIAYGVGFLIADPTGFPESASLLGWIMALTAASVATVVIGLSGRRSLLSAALVIVLGLSTAGSAVASVAWDELGAVQTVAPAVSETGAATIMRHAGQITVDLRPLAADLTQVTSSPSATPSATPQAPATPAPSPSTPTTGPSSQTLTRTAPTPQRIAIDQGGGMLQIIVPDTTTVLINAQVEFGDIEVAPDLPGSGAVNREGPNGAIELQHGQGTPVIEVNADLVAGTIKIEKG